MITQPAGHHLAEFNFGTLAYPWDDPRLADFQNALDMVNGVGARSPGFVWRLSDAEMEAVQNDPHGALSQRPNTASTLSVWESPAQLWHFVAKTLHAKFMPRASEWYVADDSGHFVGWWIPEGTRPTVAEGLQKWQQLQADGPTQDCFDAATLVRLAKG